MLAQIKEIGSPTNEEAIQRLEKIISAKLPDDYRKFLLDHNGGRPKPDGVPVPKHPEKILPIMVFHGIAVDVETSCIDWNLEVMRNRLPDKMLPVATSDFGDLYCMDLSDKHYGYVYFWDHNDECGKDCRDNIYFVSNSFTSFLERLTDEVPD